MMNRQTKTIFVSTPNPPIPKWYRGYLESFANQDYPPSCCHIDNLGLPSQTVRLANEDNK